MANLKSLLLFISIVSLSMSGCAKDDASPTWKNGTCFTGEVVKSVKNQKGTLFYDNNEKRYAVYVTIPGTYDSVDAGFICDKLDTLKIDGLPINFDGNYFAYDKDRIPPIGGLEYYYLDIVNFEIDKE